MEQDRKVEKIDLYSDRRDDKPLDETMESWDMLKLETVVNTKHGTESKVNRTKIVSILNFLRKIAINRFFTRKSQKIKKLTLVVKN